MGLQSFEHNNYTNALGLIIAIKDRAIISEKLPLLNNFVIQVRVKKSLFIDVGKYICGSRPMTNVKLIYMNYDKLPRCAGK